MEIQSAFNAGVSGFQRATELANDSAANIAGQSLETAAPEAGQAPANSAQAAAPSPTTAITEELVNLRVAEYQAKASAKVIDTADDMVGSLIDTRA